MHGIDLHWLPNNSHWSEQLASATDWSSLCKLARCRISALQTLQLDRNRARKVLFPPADLRCEPVRLAVLASSTIEHLLPGLRVAGMRRSIWIDTYTPDYGQYVQELMNPTSGLHQFNPTSILFALDAPHLLQGIEPSASDEEVTAKLEAILDRLEGQWDLARKQYSAQIIQNLPLPVFHPLIGNNEHRLAGSRLTALRRLSAMLRARADKAGVDLVALDDRVALDGLSAWHDRALWHRAKQDIHPQASPLYGDLVVRQVAAARGLSSKCLVLDLDNTLWGGVIGDDGVAGIKLGQGSARGEAHIAFQRYALDLSKRGVILAVCSKNDESNALEPFVSHPEMLLKREDIACFVANWEDKATNLRRIAARLNIGIDSLVFADDNPAERAIIRQELPTVSVPELSDDPTDYADCLADAGYFEALRITAEDNQRTHQYQQNLARESLLTATTDMNAYLNSLDMKAVWGRFDHVGLARIVQLINKTNQYNLTTRRVNESEIATLIADPSALTLQIRLLDRFGDNGIVAIVSGLFEPVSNVVRLDTWLMSCRVLGRGMEDETLNLIAAEAIRLGATALRGDYRPTEKNGMVRDHYERLGFSPLDKTSTGETSWLLDLTRFSVRPTFIHSRAAQASTPQPASAS